MACVDAATAKASTLTKSLIALSSLQSLGETAAHGCDMFQGGGAFRASGPRCACFSGAEVPLSVLKDRSPLNPVDLSRLPPEVLCPTAVTVAHVLIVEARVVLSNISSAVRRASPRLIAWNRTISVGGLGLHRIGCDNGARYGSEDEHGAKDQSLHERSPFKVAQSQGGLDRGISTVPSSRSRTLWELAQRGFLLNRPAPKG
jgi:hypothetical protein